MLSANLDQLKQLQDNCFVLGCSGGVDSIALAHWLISNNFKVHLVHVNYHKRGEASNLDQDCVKEFAQQNGIALTSFDYDSHLSKSNNFQQSAREFRYEKFKSVAADYPNSVIALAHHQDDQIETFFMNLSRKSGILGLSSMLFQHNSIVRPFLSVSKSEILDYARQHNLNWREDESNNESHYTRNRWRNEFIPLLYKEIPSLKDSVLTMISCFQSLQLELENNVMPIVSNIKQSDKLSIKSKLNLNELELFEIWRQLDQSATTFPFFMQLFDLDKGKRIEMKGEYNFVSKENEYLFFSKANEKTVMPQLEIRSVKELPLSYSKTELFLDSEKITGELKIRRWKNGDSIEPIGMKGRQLVSDIIKDAKIDSHAKKDIFVVHDEENLHWVVGLKVGKLAIANAATRNIIKIGIQ